MKNYFVNREALAVFLGLSSQRISQLVAQGMPQQDRDRYNLLVCTKFYIQFLRNHTEGATSTIANERLKLIRERAERAALENQKLRNKVIDIDGITQQVMDLMQKLRDGLSAIPGRLCHELVGKTEAEIRQSIDFDIKQALNSIAEKLEKIIEIPTLEQPNETKQATENVPIESSSGCLEDKVVSQCG